VISLCVTVLNRHTLFQNCVRSLLPCLDRRQAAGCECELVVCEWVGNQPAVSTWLPGSAIVCQAAGPFSRGRGLNEAAVVARGDQLFFIDADMLIEPQVVIDAREACLAGAAFFPVCWSRGAPGKTNGWWRDEGHGIVAMPRALFEVVGPWDEFTQWGGEDRKLFERARGACEIRRTRYWGLQHQWHPLQSTVIVRGIRKRGTG